MPCTAKRKVRLIRLNNLEADLVNVKTYYKKVKLSKAIQCYEEVQSKYPKYIRSYVRLSELYYLKKDKSRTIYYANKAIDLNPNEAYAPMTYLANKMNSNGDVEMAVLIMNRLSVSEVEGKKEKSY